jgi:hypothetical protein
LQRQVAAFGQADRSQVVDDPVATVAKPAMVTPMRCFEFIAISRMSKSGGCARRSRPIPAVRSTLNLGPELETTMERRWRVNGGWV